MKQLLKDITIRRMILGTLLTIAADGKRPSTCRLVTVHSLQ